MLRDRLPALVLAGLLAACSSDGSSTDAEPANEGGSGGSGGASVAAGASGKSGSPGAAGKSGGAAAGVAGKSGSAGAGTAGKSGSAGAAGKSGSAGGGASGKGGSAGTGGMVGTAGQTRASGSAGAPPGPPPDFGPNVLIFDPSMSTSSIQSKLDGIYGKQASNQFGTERYAYFFKPGKYDLDVQIGFYTHAIGLGASPDDVTITGAVRSKASWDGGNATLNFWRAAENLAVVPTQDGNTNVWAVSQATWMRRLHVKGSTVLSDNGWSSGGFIADSVVDGKIDSGTQQQFLLRNDTIGNWQGGSWNMVFVGDEGAPGGTWPGSPITVIDTTPVVREKPYLVIDGAGHYSVTVPGLRHDVKGPSWKANPPQTSVPIESFHVARAGTDDATSLNAALSSGKHLIITPGIYHLGAPLKITHPGTIVLGLGLATLVPDAGTEVLSIDDVDGVTVAGLIIEAGKVESPMLVRVGTPGSSADHSASPTALFDVSCRVGGAVAGTTKGCMTVESNHVITDNLWMWRADHGNGAEWGVNRSANGFIVNGDDVTAYGLFVEHFQEYQTLWNGNGGRVYFYQSEIPYDPPSQGEWQHAGKNGWASYRVADSVTTHEAWGLGVYCVFQQPVQLDSALETPNAPGVAMHHMVTLWLGIADGSAINHIINGTGDAVYKGHMQAKTDY